MKSHTTTQHETGVKKYWPTACRAVLFCFLCAGALAVSSSLTQGNKGPWSQVISIAIAFCLAFILTKVFVLWEGISMKEVGVIPGDKTLPGFLTGFSIGLLMAVLQPLLLLLTGHIKLVPIPGISFMTIGTSFTLYLLIGLREEIAFRGFPLFSINKTGGP